MLEELRSTFDPAWSRDGERLAFTSFSDESVFERQILIWDPEAGTVTPLAQAMSVISDLRWSPNDSHLVFTGRDGAWDDVWSLNLGTGALANVTDSPMDDRDPDWTTP